MRGYAEEMDSPAPQLDHEEHIEPLEKDGIDGEKVGGQDASRLGSEELGPRGASSRWRPEAMTTQHTSDGGGREPNPQLLQLTLDAHPAPASVLLAEADDELDQVRVQHQTPRPSLSSRAPPLASRSFAVSAQQGFGGDQEGPPTRSGEQTAQRSKDRPVCWSVPHTCVELRFEDAHLVPEHHDLDALVPLGPTGRSDKGKDPAQPDVEEREEHGE
jgi:hypothetical protein